MKLQQLLEEVGGGTLLERAEARLAELVLAAEETGLPGILDLRIKVERKGQSAVVTAEVKSKVPEAPLPSSSFWFFRGVLTPVDPNQLTLDGVHQNQKVRTLKSSPDRAD